MPFNFNCWVTRANYLKQDLIRILTLHWSNWIRILSYTSAVLYLFQFIQLTKKDYDGVIWSERLVPSMALS